MSDATEEKSKHYKNRKHGKIIVATSLVAITLGLGATFAIASDDDHRWGKHGGFGGHRGQVMQQMFDQMDSNGDGAITEAEAKDKIESTLANNDGNANGSLNLAEFEAVWMEHTRFKMVDVFQRLDENGDGEITAAELTEKRMAMMDRVDRNGDGQITKKEIRRGHRWHHDKDDDDDES